MTVEEAIAHIHAHHIPRGKRTLADTRALLRALGSPEAGMHLVHVAGTNGKGSTAAMLASILRCAGERVGLFTSPYLERFQERIQIDGADIPDDLLIALVEEVEPVVAALPEPPTEFELVTVLGLLAFRRSGCTWAVLEAGLGGREDFTNAIPAPAVAIITRLGLDHTERLGPTLADIAYAKAGIIKPGSTVVCYAEHPVLTAEAQKNGVPLIVAPAEPPFPVDLPLLGDFQRKNAAVAVAAAEVLGIDRETCKRGLAAVRWPGRFELLRRGPDVILDGGHNPQAAATALTELNRRYGAAPAAILTGIMADKAVAEVAQALSRPDTHYFTVPVTYPRALDPTSYADHFRALGLPAQPCASVAEGLRLALERVGEKGVVLALGTLYFSAAVREAVKKEPFPRS